MSSKAIEHPIPAERPAAEPLGPVPSTRAVQEAQASSSTTTPSPSSAAHRATQTVRASPTASASEPGPARLVEHFWRAVQPSISDEDSARRAAAMVKEREASERMRAGREQAVRMGRVRALLKGSNVPARYQDAGLADVEYPRRRLSREHFAHYCDARDKLATLLEARGSIYVLCGRNGPGKTHLAAMAVNAFCERGRPAYFCSAAHFYLRLKSTFGAPGRTAEDLAKQFREFELLAIDEIEVRSESAWENRELRDLINDRYNDLRATLLITNKSIAELNGNDEQAAYLAPWLRDRIRQDGAIIECDWPSLRAPM